MNNDKIKIFIKILSNSPNTIDVLICSLIKTLLCNWTTLLIVNTCVSPGNGSLTTLVMVVVVPGTSSEQRKMSFSFLEAVV